jgi:hypothetical protein
VQGRSPAEVINEDLIGRFDPIAPRARGAATSTFTDPAAATRPNGEVIESLP